MDHRSKCKVQNYKTPEDNRREMLNDRAFGNDFLDTTQTQFMKELTSWTYYDWKTSVLQKTPLEEWAEKPDWEKKTNYKTGITRTLIQNIQRILKSQREHEQLDWEMHKRSKQTPHQRRVRTADWKAAPHQLSSGKCKLKQENSLAVQRSWILTFTAGCTGSIPEVRELISTSHIAQPKIKIKTK